MGVFAFGILMATGAKAQGIYVDPWEDNGYVFATLTGRPIDPNNLGRHFRGLLKKAGLPPMRFHDLRHTSASLLIAQGVHFRVIQDILGHSNFNLTMNTYGHVLQSVKREAADAMEKSLWPTPDPAPSQPVLVVT